MMVNLEVDGGDGSLPQLVAAAAGKHLALAPW